MKNTAFFVTEAQESPFIFSLILPYMITYRIYRVHARILETKIKNLLETLVWNIYWVYSCLECCKGDDFASGSISQCDCLFFNHQLMTLVSNKFEHLITYKNKAILLLFVVPSAIEIFIRNDCLDAKQYNARILYLFMWTYKSSSSSKYPVVNIMLLPV